MLTGWLLPQLLLAVTVIVVLLLLLAGVSGITEVYVFAGIVQLLLTDQVYVTPFADEAVKLLATPAQGALGPEITGAAAAEFVALTGKVRVLDPQPFVIVTETFPAFVFRFAAPILYVPCPQLIFHPLGTDQL